MNNIETKERLIVALDVESHDRAIDLVKALTNVFFFKTGLATMFTINLIELLHVLQQERGGHLFFDVKMSGDIGNTVELFISRAEELGIRFITLSETPFTAHALEHGKKARNGSHNPKLLMVPLLSSMPGSVESIVCRGKDMLSMGCDGLVVSGTEAIRACRDAFQDVPIVSPGIRPSWYENGAEDHVRHTTPAEAVNAGADYIVVGRPIIRASNPKDAAQRIIDEIPVKTP